MKGALPAFLTVLMALACVACSSGSSDSSAGGDDDHVSPTIGALVSVPAGSFQRDATPTNISVITRPFWMSATEITRAQFLAVMGVDPSSDSYSSGDSDPVQNTSWYHAIAFCNKLSIAEGLTPVYSVTVGGVPVDFAALTFADVPVGSNSDWDFASPDWDADGYRLPTDMEYMWAAMGADSADPGAVNVTGYAKAFAGSTGGNAIGDYAVFGYFSAAAGRTTSERSDPVAGKLPNELGLYDMSGNIDEWCWDLYDAVPAGTLTDHTGPAPGSGSSRVRRGGSWGSDASQCTVAYRGNDFSFGVSYFIGFRVVRL